MVRPAEGPGGKALLYVGEKMCVLLTDAGGGALLLEPVRDLSAARPLFQKGAARLGARLQYLARGARGQGTPLCREGGAQQAGEFLAEFERGRDLDAIDHRGSLCSGDIGQL